MEHYYALIMAGGVGARLWPMSRETRPKQLLPLVEDASMFRVSVERLAPLVPPTHIYVVTGPTYLETLKADAPEIPPENFIVEPHSKNTGPAAALGISVIQKRDPAATVAVLTADHHIARKAAFRDVLGVAYEIAAEDYIVTLGIAPSYPATGFGYIRQGPEIRKINGFTCFKSEGFTEKPNVVTATAFIGSGLYSWNSGMFIWKAELAMREFERQQPALYAQLQRLSNAIDRPGFGQLLRETWDNLPNIQLDVAVMEGAQRMVVIPVDIGWSDIGSWAALHDVLSSDKFGNSNKGDPANRVMLDTQNTLVYSNRLTVTIGVEDMVIIDTDDALLICHKDHTQDVKEVVNHLRTTHNRKYL